MDARSLGPVMASLVFGASVAPPCAHAEDAPLSGDSARVGPDGEYDVAGLIETQDVETATAASYHGPRIPVPSAYAASLTASSDTCMGSRSLGVQAAGFGISLATTWADRSCRRIKNARQLDALGYREAAVQLLCLDEDVRRAMAQAGTPCEGVRFIDAEPPAAPEPAAEPPLIRFDNVLFDFDRATLRPEADAVLEPVLAMLRDDPAMAVDIEGHTDWVGSDAYNDGLSQRRAQAVVEWLVARGIARERLHAMGQGESEPIATNQTREGRQLNRRTEIHRRP